MDPRKTHLLEKIQVQLTVMAALGAVYFLCWPALRPSDPQLPLTFLLGDNLHQLTLFGLVLAALAVAIGLFTVTARPVGALMALSLAAGGVSLRSNSFRPLLQLYQDDLHALYFSLILETLLLAGIAFVGAALLLATRALVARIAPSWAWHPPVTEPDQADAAAPQPTAPAKPAPASGPSLTETLIIPLLLALLISVGLLMLLMRSDAHGQTLFAIIAAFLLAVLITRQAFPRCPAVLAFILPVLVSVAFYVLGSWTPIGQTPQAWVKVEFYARALPLDWMTLGIGGGLAGYWISDRLQEIRVQESMEKQEDE